jgi:flagellar motility protein MotE (MotC chaperone)
MPAEGARKRRDTIEEDDVKYDDIESSIAPISQKPKSRSKLKLFFILTLLLTGAITGMHYGGFFDVRPLVWSVAPKIPFIGSYLNEQLNIPEVYTLTVADRRRLELQQWQERLDAKERELNAKGQQSELVSNDIALRQQKMNKQEAEFSEKEKDTKGKEVTSDEEVLIKELTNTYREMSPRRSAQIMAQLPDHLAVELIKNLPQDTRASILAKMDPKRAAKITESLINP